MRACVSCGMFHELPDNCYFLFIFHKGAATGAITSEILAYNLLDAYKGKKVLPNFFSGKTKIHNQFYWSLDLTGYGSSQAGEYIHIDICELFMCWKKIDE